MTDGDQCRSDGKIDFLDLRSPVSGYSRTLKYVPSKIKASYVAHPESRACYQLFSWHLIG